MIGIVYQNITTYRKTIVTNMRCTYDVDYVEHYDEDGKFKKESLRRFSHYHKPLGYWSDHIKEDNDK